GESGSGKTTLGRAVMGLVPAESGEIRLRGAAFPRRGGPALKAWRHQIAMTFQDPTGSLSPRLTVRALIGEPFRIHRLANRDLAVAGEVRSLLNRPPGCEFHTRCPYVQVRCRVEAPDPREVARDHRARCHFPLSPRDSGPIARNAGP